ncbi:MAG: hypothetical protein HY905_20320 [Deltaproteobacteria bacterium]|nr:hypothetical protein [Deltaproteobacteria bacterium]
MNTDGHRWGREGQTERAHDPGGRCGVHASRVLLCAALSAAACAPEPVRDPAIAGDLFVLTTDFETGAFSIVDSSTGEAAVNVGLVHSDATARVRGGRVYVVNRLGQDNVTALDAAGGYSVLWQTSTEPGSNPQDIAFASDDKAYVSRLESTSLLVLDPRDGSTRGTIDLASLADADGFPEPAAMLAVGDRIVVAIERLDHDDAYRPTGPGALAVIDPATDRVERTFELAASDPYGDMALAADGRLLVAEVGVFGVLDGGLEAVDLAAGVSGGLLLDEATLGGDVTAFAPVEDGSVWLVVSDPSFVKSVVRWDPADGSRLTIVSGASLLLPCVVPIDGGRVAICDRTNDAPGLRLFTLDGVETTTQPIDVGLPPWLVRVVER